MSPLHRGALAATAFAALAGCAVDTLVTGGEPHSGTGREIAPFEFHEECGPVNVGERIDYRFQTTRPVRFEIYYKDGITSIAPISRDNVTEGSGVFPPPAGRRYCLRWETGREGAILDFRIRILPASRP